MTITKHTLAGVFLTLLICTSAALAENPMPTGAPNNGGFPNGSLDGWKERAFAGNSTYQLVSTSEGSVLKGSADGTASVLYKEETVNVGETPWLDWSWLVQNTLAPINEQTKQGDDFPARLYVVVRTGLLPWNTVAINYVWSSTSEEGSHWLSPYTEKSVMVAVNSGTEGLNEWQYERRNVVEDFKTFFNMDIDKIDGYAVMVDADNSKKSATTYFGNIEFSAR